MPRGYGRRCELLSGSDILLRIVGVVSDEIRDRRRRAASWFNASTMTEKPIAA
jgi:hypothetical protein